MPEAPKLEPAAQVREIRALRARAAGVTWMVWGMAIAATFLSFAVAGTAFPSGIPRWAFLLWLPWSLAAALATFNLWRPTRLLGVVAAPPSAKRVSVAIVLALGAVVLAIVVGGWLLPGGGGGFLSFVGLGAASLAFALLGFPSHDATQRSAFTAVGVLLAVGGILAGTWVHGDASEGEVLLTILFAALWTAGTCVGAGVYIASRS